MDFGEKLAKAASEIGKPPTKLEPKPETIQPREPAIEEIVLADGSHVKVGDIIQISLSTGEVIATPKVKQIISKHVLIADEIRIDISNPAYRSIKKIS